MAETKGGLNFFDFHSGACFDAYRYLGAHLVDGGTVFRTYAPSAQAVWVQLGDGRRVGMRRVGDGTMWEATVAGVGPDAPYELGITSWDGTSSVHCDPYGFGMDLRPRHRSIVRDLSYEFHDQEWMASRSRRSDRPLNVYELHLGSWRKRGPKKTDWFRYDEIADQLIGHVRDAGYTHVEFMPISEHPLDESWGYQNTGFFAPTSRYGTAQQLKVLVDRLHRAGLGVILDFVPVHFASDPYGLGDFDGTALYEYPRPDVGLSEWGSKNFMLSRPEVQSFLKSNANWWLDEFHFDGLRLDAVSRLLYWQGDESRGRNEGAISFVRSFNQGLHQLHPGCLLIAEDSSVFPSVTGPVESGGVGFDYKWDMGWMHDTTDFFRKQDFERRDHYNDITFSMEYFPSEHWLMSLSHDENVYGKATVVRKMFGPWERQLREARTFYLYMMCHPGKKLNFMGSEWAQEREWNEARQQDWHEMSDGGDHAAFYRYMRELNHVYANFSALWERDFAPDGFCWLLANERERLIYAFQRSAGNERLVCVLNVGEAPQAGVRMHVPGACSVRVLLNTDWQRFGGNTPDSYGCELGAGGDPTAWSAQKNGEVRDSREAQPGADATDKQGTAAATRSEADPSEKRDLARNVICGRVAAALLGIGVRLEGDDLVVDLPGDTGMLLWIENYGDPHAGERNPRKAQRNLMGPEEVSAALAFAAMDSEEDSEDSDPAAEDEPILVPELETEHVPVAIPVLSAEDRPISVPELGAEHAPVAIPDDDPDAASGES